MSEAPDTAGRQVPEDDEPTVEGRESQHDVTDTGQNTRLKPLTSSVVIWVQL